MDIRQAAMCTDARMRMCNTGAPTGILHGALRRREHAGQAVAIPSRALGCAFLQVMPRAVRTSTLAGEAVQESNRRHDPRASSLERPMRVRGTPLGHLRPREGARIYH